MDFEQALVQLLRDHGLQMVFVVAYDGDLKHVVGLIDANVETSTRGFLTRQIDYYRDMVDALDRYLGIPDGEDFAVEAAVDTPSSTGTN